VTQQEVTQSQHVTIKGGNGATKVIVVQINQLEEAEALQIDDCRFGWSL